MRGALAFVAAAAVCAALAASALAATHTIKIGDDYFVRKGSMPAVVTVKRGTTVTWRWTGGDAHNVTVSSGPVRFHSKTQQTGTYSKVLTHGGTYRIYCTVHPHQSMILKVK